MIPGIRVISSIPPKTLRKRSRSRFNIKRSFFVNFSNVPSASILSIATSLLILLRIVGKLVSIPPNQRSET